MNERTKTGLEIIKVAIALGVIGDIFLRATPWGLNVLVFNAAFVAGMIMLRRRRAPEYLTWPTLALFGAQIFFAAMFVWRDSIELRIADTFAILSILSALFLPRMKVVTRVAGVFHYVVGFMWSAGSAAFAPCMLIFSDVKWAQIPSGGWRKHAFSAFRGVAIAAPLILIFGALFVAADAAYEGLVIRVFNIRPEIVFTHILLFGVFSWMTAGYLRGALINAKLEEMKRVSVPDPSTSEANPEPGSHMDRVLAEPGENPVMLPDHLSVTEHINISDPPQTKDETASEKDTEAGKKGGWAWATVDNSILPSAFTLSAVEVGVILGLMNLLFLSFVIVQVPYLFGGMELVQNTPDFKLAEYARRGFGELVTVSALVLPILLAGHWLVRKENRSAEKLFRILAGTQIILLFVIMASAVQRLVLLTGNLGYGLTTIRLYPMIFMTWLAIVFVWFVATVLRGARQHFAWGALWSAFLILGATHVLNPDAFIVKTNIALMQQGREFDSVYNSRLSDDALPTLVNSFIDLNQNDQQIIVRRLALRYCRKSVENDLRSWNFSRWNASRTLGPDPEFVRQLGSCENGIPYFGPDDSD